MLDFSKIHNPNHEISQAFVDKLSEVTDMTIFDHKSIQAIINFRWKLAKRYVMFFQMIPYCCFFICYFIYAIVIFDIDQELESEEGTVKEKDTVLFDVFDKFWLALLLLFCVYFLR